MKKIAVLLIAIITIVSCKKEHSKDYLTLQGKFKNSKDSVITIVNRTGFSKKIKLNSDGTFKDTLKVAKNGVYFLQTSPTKKAPIHLGNGYDLTLNGDADNFVESFSYKGNGADSNNFILSQIAFSKKMGNPMDLFSLEKDAFDAKISGIKKGMDSLLNLYPNIDTTLLANSKKQKEQMASYFEKGYAAQHEAAKERAAALAKVAKGKVSPKFVNYVNYKGGKTSLNDLKGKYVYVDMWATWCKPCLGEIPSLQALEKEYHGKNIEFVSISVDNERTAKTWENAETKWKAMVANKNLSGMQLWAGKDNSFSKAYQVNSIPRFILIDPQGNIVDNNAPRPSETKLKELLSGLGI